MTPPTSMCTGAVYRVGVAGHGTPEILAVYAPFWTLTTGDVGVDLAIGVDTRLAASNDTGNATLSSSVTSLCFYFFLKYVVCFWWRTSIFSYFTISHFFQRGLFRLLDLLAVFNSWRHSSISFVCCNIKQNPFSKMYRLYLF